MDTTRLRIPKVARDRDVSIRFPGPRRRAPGAGGRGYSPRYGSVVPGSAYSSRRPHMP